MTVEKGSTTPLEAAESALANATRDAETASRCAAAIKIEAGAPPAVASHAAQAYAAAAQAWGAVAQAEATLYAAVSGGVQARAVLTATERLTAPR